MSEGESLVSEGLEILSETFIFKSNKINRGMFWITCSCFIFSQDSAPLPSSLRSQLNASTVLPLGTLNHLPHPFAPLYSLLRPVKLNMPICSVMWCQVPGVLRASSRDRSSARICKTRSAIVFTLSFLPQNAYDKNNLRFNGYFLSRCSYCSANKYRSVLTTRQKALVWWAL